MVHDDEYKTEVRVSKRGLINFHNFEKYNPHEAIFKEEGANKLDENMTECARN